MKALHERTILGLAIAALALWVTAVASSEASEVRAFERAVHRHAPAGYVAYLVRLWGTKVSGRVTSVTLTEDGGMLKFHTDGEHEVTVDRVDTDGPVESVIYALTSFRPDPRVLMLPVHRPVAFSLNPAGAQPFILRFVGMDPGDPTIRLYEAPADSVVFYGTVLGFHLDDASVKAGYPYRGPFSYSGPVKFRLPRFAGEKSAFKIPTSVEIPDILIERS